MSLSNRLCNSVVKETSIWEFRMFLGLTAWMMLSVCYLTPVSGEKLIKGQSQIIEGDIFIDQKTSRAAVTQALVSGDEYKPWPDNQIVYNIDSSIRYERKILKNLKIAMETIRDKTHDCVRFIPKASNSVDYINITRDGPGCYSSVGRTGKEQPLNIGVGCEAVGIIIHELLHAMGFWHEQSRSDRDNFVDIKYQNILFYKRDDFEKRERQHDLESAVPYDFHSILHYKHNQFAKESSLDTILPKAAYSYINKDELGQRTGLSDNDVSRIMWLYKCGQYTLQLCKAPSYEYGRRAELDMYTVGSVYQHDCKSGYLIGPKQSTCQPDGTWSGAVPFCVQAATRKYSFCDMESGCYGAWYPFTSTSRSAKWLTHRGPSPTTGTGPVTDHTYGNTNGSYLLMNGNGVPAGEYALVLAPRVAPKPNDTICILFYYYMHGSGMGSLNVYANWSPVFTQHGSDEDKWKRALITDFKSWYGYTMVMFHAIRGSTDNSDIAIDDVFIGPCKEIKRYITVLDNYKTNS